MTETHTDPRTVLPRYARTWILEAEGGYVNDPRDPLPRQRNNRGEPRVQYD